MKFSRKTKLHLYSAGLAENSLCFRYTGQTMVSNHAKNMKWITTPQIGDLIVVDCYAERILTAYRHSFDNMTFNVGMFVRKSWIP